jgi:hypothetical protein
MVESTGFGRQGSESNPQVDFTCKFCNRAFTREKTLSNHVCEQKRRFQAKEDKWVQLGFQAYLRFFEYTQPTTRQKTYQEFSESPYYLAFVKFGRYMVNVRCINTAAFIDWVIKQNKKLDKWGTDAVYEEFLKTWIKHENHLDAINRTIETITEWATQTNNPANAYFRYAPTSRVAYDLTRGRISPWCLYCSDSGQEFLNALTEDNLTLVYEWIDPTYWGNKMTTYRSEQIETELIMKELKF